MLEFPVSLTHRSESAEPRSAAAWLLPGPDVEAWVRSLIASGLPNLDSQLLFPIPKSAATPAAAGLFVPLEKSALSPPARALIYALEGGRVFVPAEATLRYPLTEAEFASCFLHDFVVLHPGAGLIGFDKSDALTLSDLLQRPKSTGALWNRAHPGLPPAPDKLQISVAESKSTPLADARGDIGTKATEQLPGYPGEPRDGFLGGGARKFLQSLRGKNGGQGGGKISEWAQKQLEKIRDKQQREIDRLLELLSRNPDEGLRFALPIGGGDGGRGVVPPGGELKRHDVDFTLADLSGGLPISPWILDPGQLERLMRSYRDVANRELNLGRHRRAAYILGNLLNDFHAAANVLEQGGHYREAAALYQKHLHDDAAAARCLQNGGLFEEAIDIFKRLGNWETIGDLYSQLERKDDARAAYLQGVEYFRTHNEPIRTQQLLEGKLNDPEAALVVLLEAFDKDETGSLAALRESFHLRERHGWHESALNAVEDLAERFSDPDTAIKSALPELLRDVAKSYAQTDVADAAADATLVLIGLSLERQSQGQTNQALSVVASLEPDDLVLERDTRRFQNRPKPASPPPAADSATIRCKLIEVRAATEKELHSASDKDREGPIAYAKDIVRSDHWLLEFQNGELVLVQLNLEEAVQQTHHLTNFPQAGKLERAEDFRIAAIDGAVFIGFDRLLFRFFDGELQRTELPSPVDDLCAAPTMLAISMETGAGLARLDRDWRRIRTFAQSSMHPLVGFTRNGFLIAADERFIRVFSAQSDQIALKTSIEARPKQTAVLAGPDAGQFRVLAKKECAVYELS